MLAVKFEPSEELKKALNDASIEIGKKAEKRFANSGRSINQIIVDGKTFKAAQEDTPSIESLVSERVQDVIGLQYQLMDTYIKFGVDPNKAAQCTSYTIWAYLGAGDIVIDSGDDRD